MYTCVCVRVGVFSCTPNPLTWMHVCTLSRLVFVCATLFDHMCLSSAILSSRALLILYPRDWYVLTDPITESTSESFNNKPRMYVMPA